MTAILKVDTIQDTSGNNMINESSDTITIGASGDTTNIIGTLQNNGSALNFATVNGITMADVWRLSAGLSSVSVDGFLTSNWEKADDTTAGYIGSSMSESSGVFTFPSTGMYLVTFYLNGKSVTSSNTRYMNGRIYTTSNNSSYNIVARGMDSAGGNAQDFCAVASYIVDVTDTANVKVKFSYEFENSGNIYGTTNENQTYATFVRLGDT